MSAFVPQKLDLTKVNDGQRFQNKFNTFGADEANALIEGGAWAIEQAEDAQAKATTAKKNSSDALAQAENAQRASVVAENNSNASAESAANAEQAANEAKRVATNVRKRLANLEESLSPSPFMPDEGVAQEVFVPTNALSYAYLNEIGGKTIKQRTNNFFDANAFSEIAEDDGFIFDFNEATGEIRFVSSRGQTYSVPLSSCSAVYDGGNFYISGRSKSGKGSFSPKGTFVYDVFETGDFVFFAGNQDDENWWNDYFYDVQILRSRFRLTNVPMYELGGAKVEAFKNGTIEFSAHTGAECTLSSLSMLFDVEVGHTYDFNYTSQSGTGRFVVNGKELYGRVLIEDADINSMVLLTSTRDTAGDVAGDFQDAIREVTVVDVAEMNENGVVPYQPFEIKIPTKVTKVKSVLGDYVSVLDIPQSIIDNPRYGVGTDFDYNFLSFEEEGVFLVEVLDEYLNPIRPIRKTPVEFVDGFIKVFAGGYIQFLSTPQNEDVPYKITYQVKHYE